MRPSRARSPNKRPGGTSGAHSNGERSSASGYLPPVLEAAATVMRIMVMIITTRSAHCLRERAGGGKRRPPRFGSMSPTRLARKLTSARFGAGGGGGSDHGSSSSSSTSGHCDFCCWARISNCERKARKMSRAKFHARQERSAEAVQPRLRWPDGGWMHDGSKRQPRRRQVAKSRGQNQKSKY